LLAWLLRGVKDQLRLSTHLRPEPEQQLQSTVLYRSLWNRCRAATPSRKSPSCWYHLL